MIITRIKNANWPKCLQPILAVILFAYINFYLLIVPILKQSIANHNVVGIQTLFNFSGITFGLALTSITVILTQFINVSFLKKLGLGYLTYLLVSYFILVTRYLNDDKFKVWDFSKLSVTTNSFLLPLVGMLVATIILKIFLQRSSLDLILSKYMAVFESSDSILFGMISSFIINDKHLVTIFRDDILSSFLEKADYTAFIRFSVINLLLCLITFHVICYYLYKAYESITNNKPSIHLAFASSLLLALVFNYCFQYGLKKDAMLLERYIFPGATAYQIAFLFFLFFVIYLLINRYVLSTVLSLSLGILLSIANATKVRMRNEPLLMTDFVWLKDLSFLSSFDTNLFIKITGISLGIVVLYFIVRKYIFPGKILNDYKVRLFYLFFIMFFGLGTLITFRHKEDNKVINGIPVLSKVSNWNDIDWMGFLVNARYKSLAYIWTKQLTGSIMEVPSGYSKASVKRIAKLYKEEATQINQTRFKHLNDQTVIFVLSESFANPERIAGVSLSKNIIPNISEVMKTNTSGTMVSDFYGGGTANVEIQTLTGLPYSNFSPSVAVVNTEVIPSMPYVPSISDTFKNNDKYAVHLHNATNYARNVVYNDLGFNTFVALDGTKDKPTQLEFLSAGATDKSSYHAVLSHLDKNKNQFFSVITMQNHIPWTKEEPADISGTGKGFTEEENTTLSNYSRLLNVTDQMTQDFLNELSSYEKNVTVVFYGDHLPGFYPNSAFSSNPGSQYETDYFIWSNYETEKLDYPKVHSSDFPALILKHTNAKVSPYGALLTKLLDNRDQKAVFKKLNEDLKILQYDLTLGHHYILDDKEFFKVK
ncbi:LTA synthase family protein [Streptococcus phocae]|uniref:Phosphoglycerol transferase n=1 Tax=Streptococcus phocae TaxID=119224 RepID=A0A0P6S479_9STRE|nr:alkaline phosphatase family protein [Streptococcus phocae]KPJ22040.1 phosphoglycerol transferase [Streptococcus phocae]